MGNEKWSEEKGCMMDEKKGLIELGWFGETPMTTPLTREQVEMLANGLNKDGLSFEQRLAIRSLMGNDGDLRESITQQAQEIERLKVALTAMTTERDEAARQILSLRHEAWGLVEQRNAAQARVQELEAAHFTELKEKIRYAGEYRDAKRNVEQLQATLAARENEVHNLATSHDAMLLRLGEAERGLYAAFHEHGEDNGMWGKWCARLLTQRDTARQDAARLKWALEALWRMTEIHKITDLDAHAVISKALKGA